MTGTRRVTRRRRCSIGRSSSAWRMLDETRRGHALAALRVRLSEGLPESPAVSIAFAEEPFEQIGHAHRRRHLAHVPEVEGVAVDRQEPRDVAPLSL